jgi:hypothetical protein
MDIFDDDKKTKPDLAPLGYTLDDITEKLDYDLKCWIAFSGFSLNTDCVFEMSTICCMLFTEREIQKSSKKYSEKDLALIDDSNSALLEMMHKKKKRALN